MIKIEIYTDGSCNQKKETGGWAFIILENEIIKKEKRGPEVHTTNSRCELLGAIKALEELETIEFSEDIEVTVVSDSAYVVNAFVDNWIGKWEKNGWLNANREPVSNKEYWDRLILLQRKFKVSFIKIKRRSNKIALKVDSMAKNPLVHIPS